MNNKNVFWIKVKNSSTVSNIFSSTILGQLRKESIYDYGKTNSFVFNKYFDNKKSFWVEAKSPQDIIELIEILSQEFSTPILALWNRKYIAYNSIGRRIEIESEFEKDYCLVASILEESTGYSFDADDFFEEDQENEELSNYENDYDDEEDEYEEDEVESYNEFKGNNKSKKSFNHDDEYFYDDEEEYNDSDEEIENNDDDEDEIFFDENEETQKKSCGDNCKCFSNDEFNPIDEIKKETMYHSEKVIELCDEILNSEKSNDSKFEKSNCACNSMNDFMLDDSVNIENDEYVCNGSCSKNINDFDFFFEENNIDEENNQETLFDVEINVENNDNFEVLKDNDSFEVKEEEKESDNFNLKIEEEKKNFESTYFDLEEQQKKSDFIIETIENIDSFLNDKTNTEINIEFDLDKEIEGESFDEENSLSEKYFDQNSEKSFNDFFIVEDDNLEKKTNEDEINFFDKKKSFDANLEENEEKVLDDFFSILNDNSIENENENELFEKETINNLTVEEENFDSSINESVLDNVFESLEDKKEEKNSNDLLNDLFLNDEVNTKTNEIELDELLSTLDNNDINENIESSKEKNIENENLLNELFSEQDVSTENENINLADLFKENNVVLEEEKDKKQTEEILNIDNDALFEKNDSFNTNEEENSFLNPNENIDFDLYNKEENKPLNIEEDINFNLDNNETIINDEIVTKNETTDTLENNVSSIFDQIEKVEDSMYEIYESNANISNLDDSIVNLNENFDHVNSMNIDNDNEVVTFDDDNLNIEQTIFETSNDLLNETNEYVVEDKNKTLYDVVLDSTEEEVDKLAKELETSVSLSNEEVVSETYKSIHEKNKKVSDELNIFLDELKKEKDLINNREEVILKREKKLKEIMNSDYAKNINIDSSNRKWRVIR